MSVPLNVVFDRFAVVSSGLTSVDVNLPLILGFNCGAIVTQFVDFGAFGGWIPCNNPVTTVWTLSPYGM